MVEQQWIPHQPNTWPFRFAKLKKEVRLRTWAEYKRDDRGNPIFVEAIAPAGTLVKIVMVSRLGDVGITDDLGADNGYKARILLNDLTEAHGHWECEAYGGCIDRSTCGGCWVPWYRPVQP